METLYRYDAVRYTYSVDLILTEYKVVKTTPCGYWVVPKGLYSIGYNTSKIKKWVSASGRKRLCYPTKSEAFESFYARTRSRVEHCKRNLTVAEAASRLSRNITEVRTTSLYPNFEDFRDH